MIIMEDGNLKFFKLDYSGSFEEIRTDSPLELFTLVDILAIYISMQKRMYIWIGKKATQSLRKYIPQIRTRFSEKLPELKILRNITIESGSEPSDFFQFISFTWTELNSHIEEQEAKLEPILKKIEILKGKVINLANSEEYEEAIRFSEEIIEFSKKVKDKALENEQRDNIKDLKSKAKNKIDIDKIEDETNNIRKEFDLLIGTYKSEDIIEAHNIIGEYKKKYENIFDLSILPSAKELILEEKKIWNNYIVNQDSATKELKKLANEITPHIEKKEFTEAENILMKARELLIRVIDDDLKDKWNEIESDLLEYKKKHTTLEEIERTIEKSSILTESLKFEEALSEIESTIELIQDKEILEYSHKLKEKKSEILAVQINYALKREKIAVLEEKIKENRKYKHLNAAIINCENIIKISESIKNHDTVIEYAQILEEIKDEIEEIKVKQKENQEKLINKAKDLEEVIETEENILPIIEEFSVNEILGDLSDDVNEMLEQVGNLLNDHRVEIKYEIFNKALLISESGDVVELEQNFEIQRKEEKDERVKFNVRSGLVNPFDDVIEKAVLTDLIPYNFEITDVKLNGEPIKDLPDKLLTKDGVELNWQIQKILPKEKVEINYELRWRVSRTIIFILKNQLKIIKTHSNLSMLEFEGLYEVRLPFTNSFGDVIEGVIVEDIIPLCYFYFIKEPINILPTKTSRSKLGELVKWNIGSMESETFNYQYGLLEPHLIEEIKINISNLSKDGIDYLNKGDLSKALTLYEKIINQLEEYNK